MRLITVPDNITFLDTDKKPLAKPGTRNNERPDGIPLPAQTFYANFLADRLDDAKMAKNGGELSASDIRTSIKLHEKFENVKPGDVVELDEEHWNRLKKSVEEPTGGYIAAFARQLQPFINAVLDAPEKK